MLRWSVVVLGMSFVFTACDEGEISPVQLPVDDDKEILSVDLPNALDSDQMWSHLEALQEIADANNGNRSLGSTGYDASVEYVVSELGSYGYEVVRDAFDVEEFVVDGDPVLTHVSGVNYDTNSLRVLTYSGSGEVTALATFVDVLMPPPLQSNASTSGCELEDFAAFPSGNIAIIQRGTCYFQDKVDNAVAAGASAVLIFNEGQPGRTDVVEGTLSSEANNMIPVLGLSYGIAEAMEVELGNSGELEMTVVVEASVSRIPSTNVLAETEGGNPSNVVVVGAHLDSVPNGPGINDNGTGVALVLELARQVALLELVPTNQLQFALWGGEEFGLLGSIDYVLTNSESGELASVMANLNYDMIGSPNPARFIYDGDGSDSGSPGPAGSDQIESMYETWFDGLNLSYLSTPFDGRSDYGAFVYFDIPAGGLFSGAEAIKDDTTAQSFGGTPNVAFDQCYHQSCDTLENVDRPLFEELAAAAAYAMVETAMLESGFSRRSAPVDASWMHSVVPDQMAGCRGHVAEPELQ